MVLNWPAGNVVRSFTGQDALKAVVVSQDGAHVAAADPETRMGARIYAGVALGRIGDGGGPVIALTIHGSIGAIMCCSP
jgi:hypothetical protein